MDRQCGRQLYDRTCCAKQMWERLRRPMNTKQSRRTNPTLSCVELGVARLPPPGGHTLQVPWSSGGTPDSSAPESQASASEQQMVLEMAPSRDLPRRPCFPWRSLELPKFLQAWGPYCVLSLPSTLLRPSMFTGLTLLSLSACLVSALTPPAPAPSSRDPLSLPSSSEPLQPAAFYPLPDISTSLSCPTLGNQGPAHALGLCHSLLPCSRDSYQRAEATSGAKA